MLAPLAGLEIPLSPLSVACLGHTSQAAFVFQALCPGFSLKTVNFRGGGEGNQRPPPGGLRDLTR